MSVISVLLPPLIGGVIGYITNDLAIKMLFRPYRPVTVGKFRLPFTPGIVPKRLPQLAVLLGREVEAQFFNADDLEILFQSDGFSDAVANSLTDMLYEKKTTLCYTMEGLEAREDTGAVIRAAKHKLCRHINQALIGFDFAPVISRAAENIGSDKRAVKNLVSSLAPGLSDGIHDFLREKGERTIYPMIEEMLVDFGDRPMKDIVSDLLPERELTRQLIKNAYLRFMSIYVRPVVESIDVGGMITEKLRKMEPKAVETLILSVVNREFRYVVWLGGLLGVLIGTVNIFI